MPETLGPGDANDLSYIQAVNEALRWALRAIPETFVFGEDVAVPGGPYGATKGLLGEFGDRVFDTPISESAMMGAAIGAAMRGYRPIVEIMFMDFTLVAMDQFVNQAANARYVSRGSWIAPITVRTQAGVMSGSCAQHSQYLEAFFAHVPGWRICLPATPQDAYDLLRAAVVCDDPTLVVENRSIYAMRGSVIEPHTVERPGSARVVREGRDVTVVSWSRMVLEAAAAAERVSELGIAAEVVDLRWLSPLDVSTVLGSVGRTGRLVIAHEANLTGGFGAELAARVGSEGYSVLRAPIRRVAAPDLRMPAAVTLQQAVVPDAETIATAILATVGEAPIPTGGHLGAARP